MPSGMSRRAVAAAAGRACCTPGPSADDPDLKDPDLEDPDLDAPARDAPGPDARGPPDAPRRAPGAADLEVPEFQPGRAADADPAVPEPEPRGLPGPLGRPRAAVPSGAPARAPDGRPD